MNGKSVNAWMEYEDSTDGHVWHVYESYKLVDPSAMGTVTGTVESYGDPDETITIQLVNSGNGSRSILRPSPATAPNILLPALNRDHM